MEKEFKIKVSLEEGGGSCNSCFLNDTDINCTDICPGDDNVLVINGISEVDVNRCVECGTETINDVTICTNCFYK